MGRSPLACAVAAVLALVGCATEAPLPPVKVPPGTSGMTLTPSVASPGGRVELSFAPGTLRGAGYTLATGDGEVRYYLSVAYGGQEADWWTTDDRPVGSIGFEGPGPERLVVPDTVDPGDYLLCDWGDDYCAVLTVEH